MAISDKDNTDELEVTDLDLGADIDEDLLIEEYEKTHTSVDAEEDLDDDEGDYEEGDDEEEATGLKNKLISMFSKKSKKDDEDDEDDEDEEGEDEESESKSSIHTITNMLQSKLPFLSSVLKKQKKDEGDDSTDVDLDLDDEDSEEPKKKFEIKRVHIIGIVVIIVIALMDFEEEVVPEPVTKPRAKKLVKKKNVPKVKAVVKSPEPEPVTIPEPVDVDIQKAIDEANKNLGEDPVVEPEPEPIIAEPEPERIIAEPEPIVAEPELIVAESEPIQNEIDPQDNNFGNQMGEGNANGQIDETVTSIDSFEPDVSAEITKKLLGDLEVRLKEERKEQSLIEVLKPVSAPLYDSIGKGLVYNCRDQHWACIEVPAYKKCRQNYSWNKSNNIPTECYPFAVLESSYDCATVQQEKIDSIGATGFCRE